MRCKKLRPFWFLSFVTVACCAIPATRASADSDLPEAPFSEIPLLPDHLRKPDEVAPGQKTISMAPPPNSVAPHDYYVSAKREPPKDIFGANSLLAAIDLGIRQNGGGFSYIMPQKDFYSYALTFDFESRLLDGLTYNTYGPGLFGELHYNFRNRVVPFIGVGLGFQHWHASGTANNQPEQVNGGTIAWQSQYGMRFVLTSAFSLIFREKDTSYPPHSRPEEVASWTEHGDLLRDQQVLFAYSLISN